MELIKGHSYIINIFIRNYWCDNPEYFTKINNHPFIYHHPVTFIELNDKFTADPFKSYIFISHLDLYELLKENSDFDMFSYLVNTCQLTHTSDNKWQIHIFKDRFEIIPDLESQKQDQ
jgi:hypothetical protein